MKERSNLVAGVPMINRRNVLRAGLLLGSMATGGRLVASGRGGKSRPNILFILADDMRFDAVGYRNPDVRTPNLDRLAGEAARFRNHFVTTSICCTSRASIFTGTYARRHHVWDFTTSLPVALRDQTYPAVLKLHGYRTGFFGKYGVNSLVFENRKIVGETIPEGERDQFSESTVFDDYFASDDPQQQHHNNERIAQLAERFLDGGKAGEPFCLSLSFKAPHAKDDGDLYMGDFVAEQDMFARYARDIFTEGPTVNDGAYRSRPEFIQHSESRTRWQRRFSTPWLWQDSVRKYYALISGMDRAVGRVVARLKEAGLYDDTIIIFTSDNGYFLGDYGLSDKWYGYEASIRVPLFIRMPGGAGREVDDVSLNIDLAPTILAMAGVPVPPVMQGANLIPLVDGKTPAGWRTDFLYEHFLTGRTKADANRMPFTIASSEGVRNARYTYLRYPQYGFEELFDRIADPDEMINIAPTAAPGVLEDLRKRTDELIRRNS
jgi:arylsulfatase A-like enzyme